MICWAISFLSPLSCWGLPFWCSAGDSKQQTQYNSKTSHRWTLFLCYLILFHSLRSADQSFRAHFQAVSSYLVPRIVPRALPQDWTFGYNDLKMLMSLHSLSHFRFNDTKDTFLKTPFEPWDVFRWDRQRKRESLSTSGNCWFLILWNILSKLRTLIADMFLFPTIPNMSTCDDFHNMKSSLELWDVVDWNCEHKREFLSTSSHC